MSRIPQHFIDDLLNRLDIVEVIDHRVKLKKSGKNYSACCPFHDEKTPSFTVSPDKQFYYCFGCGASGSAVGFLMEYEHLGFVDAVENLARVAGLEVPREEPSARQQQQHSQQKKLYDILAEARDYFQQQLKHHPQRQRAVVYLQNRGLTGQIAKAFGLGYAPPGWDNLLLSLGDNEARQQLLIDAGLAVVKEEDGRCYDRFRQRIMFPILDNRGRVIGFGGRVLGDDKPKYLNSPETEVFHKGRELYGLYQARQHKGNLENLLVVEGYMDVIALAQYGIHNAVATLGTACGEEHLRLAFRHVNEVVFCFDGDQAGRNAAKRALANTLGAMEDGRQVKFLFLPEGQDPDSLVRQIGAERFQAQIKNAVPLEEFLFEVAAEGIDTSSMEGRARFSKIAAPLVGQLPDGVYRELMFSNLARRTGLDPEMLRELQKQKIELNLKDSPSDQPATGENRDTPASHRPPRTRANRSSVELTPVRTATILLLEHPQLLTQLDIPPELAAEGDNELQRLLDLIAYLQRRPGSNFNSILGHWGGTHGVDAQQALAKLVANQLLGDAKIIETYKPLEELQDALRRIQRQQQRAQHALELGELKARGLAALSDAEKQRYRELVSATK